MMGRALRILMTTLALLATTTAAAVPRASACTNGGSATELPCSAAAVVAPAGNQ